MKVSAFASASLMVLLTACSSRPYTAHGGITAAPQADSSVGSGTGAAGTGTGGAATSTGGGGTGTGGAGTSTGGAGTSTGGAGTSTGAGATSGSANLTVHEWGTFTSVNNSAGALMEGLHHEEEALPLFVYGRAKVASGGTAITGGKSLEAQPTGVTQKLETPVLYFYGTGIPSVRVRVDFPKGVLSEWYPNAAMFGPKIGAATGSTMTVAGGFMEWRADLSPSMTQADFPPVVPEDIWAPSRRVASLPVTVGAEHEQFIFYRGLGSFKLPLTIDVDANGLVNIHNQSSDSSPAVYLLRVHAGGGAIVDLGPLAAGGHITGVPMPAGGKEHDLSVYVKNAQDRIAQAVQGTGLYADEARAMVETWSRSYFQSYGLRILYVVPRAWTDSLLPLTIEPTPRELVRTLMGRVEVLAPAEENDLLARAVAASAGGVPASTVIKELGRLAEPKLRRVLELTTDPTVRAWCQSAIATAAAMP
ncbi:MAG: hypothetical protein ABJA82_08590 [Myxococcales bacterium]